MLRTLLLATTLFAQAASPPPDAGAAHASLNIPFEKYVLAENGLEVILSEDHSLPLVAVDIWYHAGPINESAKRTGFAHLFEHLMFQGSKHVGDDQHLTLLEARGASAINGTTSLDRTNYLETVPAHELELALWLESDRMGFLGDSLTQQNLDGQRQVVKNERRQRVDNVPYAKSHERLMQTLFRPEHPYYGNIIGSMQDLDAATLEDARAFWDAYYAPSNATLVLAGDFDPNRARDLIARYFGSLPARTAPKAHPVTTEPITSQRRVSVIEDVPLPQVSLAWLSAPAYQPGDAEADILAGLLGQGDSSRLYRHLVYERGLAQEVGVGNYSAMLTGIFQVSAIARPGVDIGLLEKEIVAQLERIKEAPPSEEELMRMRNQIKTRHVQNLQRLGSFSGRAETLNHYNQFKHDPGFLAADLARYDQVTPESVRQYAARLLSFSACVVVVTVPK